MRAATIGRRVAAAAVSGLLLGGVPLLACEVAAPRAARNAVPQWIDLDVELPVWELGRWTVDGFSQSLRAELEGYNIHVDPHPAQGRPLVLVDLGMWENRRAIDVSITRAGRTVHAGRVMIPDRSMTTLDASAALVASVIASALAPPVDPAPPLPPPSAT
jgi:hypothetical protein